MISQWNRAFCLGSHQHWHLHLTVLMAQVPQCFCTLVVFSSFPSRRVCCSTGRTPMISRDFGSVPKSPPFTRKRFNSLQLSPFIKSHVFHAISSKYIWMCVCPINHVCRDTLGALSWPCVGCLQSSWFLCWAGGVASGICHQNGMKDQERQPPVLNVIYRCQRSLKESKAMLQSWLRVGSREGIEKSQGNERKNSTPCLGTHT